MSALELLDKRIALFEEYLLDIPDVNFGLFTREREWAWSKYPHSTFSATLSEMGFLPTPKEHIDKIRFALGELKLLRKKILEENGK